MIGVVFYIPGVPQPARLEGQPPCLDVLLENMNLAVHFKRYADTRLHWLPVHLRTVRDATYLLRRLRAQESCAAMLLGALGIRDRLGHGTELETTKNDSSVPFYGR